MFEKFGEFNSYEEINTLAENLLNEGDIDSLSILAKENGIPREMVKLYREGEIPFLTDPQTAAVGKLEIEEAQLKPKEIMQDWLDYIKIQCMEHESVAKAVRKKGKSLKGCIGALLAWSFKNQQDIDKEIIEKAGISAKKVTLGIPGMGRAKQIIKEYYTKEERK